MDFIDNIDNMVNFIWAMQKSNSSQGITNAEYNNSFSDFLFFEIQRNKDDTVIHFLKSNPANRYFVWFEKHQLSSYLLLLKSDIRQFTTLNHYHYHINNSIDNNAEFLFKGHEKFSDYYARWIYLITLQAYKNFNRTYFNLLANSNYIKTMLQNILHEFDIKYDKNYFPSLAGVRTWLIPSGVIYKLDLCDLKPVFSFNDLCAVIFDEITYIRANYQMCVISEDNEYLRNVLRSKMPVI